MFKSRILLGVIGGVLLMVAAAPAAAQEVVVTGPPPELRKNLDAFQKAFNSGDAEAFEAMAKTTYTPQFFKKQTADERKAAFKKLHATFGMIKFERVERNGPDEPLLISVKGTVASGTFVIDIDESSRIDGLKAEAGKAPNADRRH
jgi:hypothetical protein